MADIDKAVQFVLGLEDSRLTGDVTTLPGDRGGPTRFGLASRWHPKLVEKGFYEVVDGQPKIPNDEAKIIADGVYEQGYGKELALGQITSQDVANRLLSFGINEGTHEAVALCQRTLNFLGAKLAVDGNMGPGTLAALNSADPEKFIDAERACQRQFYRHLVAVRPSLLPDLKGLLNRADA